MFFGLPTSTMGDWDRGGDWEGGAHGDWGGGDAHHVPLMYG